jgi:hypothetical protein
MVDEPLLHKVTGFRLAHSMLGLQQPSDITLAHLDESFLCIELSHACIIGQV